MIFAVHNSIDSYHINSVFGFVVAFFGGILSFVSPCVLPLVPGYVSLVSGLSAAEIKDPSLNNRIELIRSSLLFVFGFTVVFVLLGASASSAGNFLLHHQVVFNHVSGVIVVVMGLLLAGMIRWMPLMQERRFHLNTEKVGSVTAPLMGMAFAFGWTPCIGAILAPILVLAAGEKTVWHGAWLLLWYSLGLGVPFIACSLGFTRLSSTTKWFRRHAMIINLISGLLLVLFGVLLFTNNLTHIANWMVRLMSRMGIKTLPG